MSLINRMLQDLDQRHAGTGELASLSAEVRPLPEQRRSRYLRWVGLGVLITGAVAGYIVLEQGERAVGQTAAVIGPVEPPAAPVVQPPAPLPEAMAQSTGVAQGEGQTETGLRTATELNTTPVRDNVSYTFPLSEPAAPLLPTKAPDKPVAKAAEKPAAKVEETGRIDKVARPESAEGAEAIYRRAIDLLGLGRQGDAIDALRAGLRAEATHVGARQLLARLLIEQRDLEGASATLREGCRLLPQQAQWAMALARLDLERGDDAAAWRGLEQSSQYATNQADFQAMAGAVLQRMGRHSDAAERYRAALRLAPNDPRAWVGLGLALESGGHQGEATEAFRRARASGSLAPDLASIVDQKLR